MAAPLVVLIHQYNWTFVCMPSKQEVVAHRKQHHRPINQNAPVHGLRHHRCRQREECKNIDQQEEQYGDDIAREPSAAQAPACVRKRVVADPAQSDARDGDDVGAENGADGERHDGVESDCAAEVDEREEAGNDEGDVDGVERDVPAGTDAVVFR
jgi:hypothetical protein